MNTKKLISVLLFVFVVASVGTIIARETGLNFVKNKDGTVLLSVQESQAAPQTAQINETQKQPEISAPAKVIVYYFYGKSRCYSCHKIEAFTREAIQGGFEQEIKDGRVELKNINIEKLANRHYIQDYQLASRSVVVARYKGHEQKDWERLDYVWQIVGDYDAFIAFVREKTSAFLKANET